MNYPNEFYINIEDYKQFEKCIRYFQSQKIGYIDDKGNLEFYWMDYCESYRDRYKFFLYFYPKCSRILYMIKDASRRDDYPYEKCMDAFYPILLNVKINKSCRKILI